MKIVIKSPQKTEILSEARKLLGSAIARYEFSGNGRDITLESYMPRFYNTHSITKRRDQTVRIKMKGYTPEFGSVIYLTDHLENTKINITKALSNKEHPDGINVHKNHMSVKITLFRDNTARLFYRDEGSFITLDIKDTPEFRTIIFSDKFIGSKNTIKFTHNVAEDIDMVIPLEPYGHREDMVVLCQRPNVVQCTSRNDAKNETLISFIA